LWFYSHAFKEVIAVVTHQISKGLLALIMLTTLLVPVCAGAEFFSYEDRSGTIHFVDDPGKIPKEYRQKKQVRKDKYDDLPDEERALRLENERQEHEAVQSREAEQQEQIQMARSGKDQTLLNAIERGRHSDVIELLRRGADPNARDPLGRTALMYAGINGQTDTMEILIEKGAQINAKSRKRETPLIAAIFFGDPNAIRLLIDKGADVNATFYLGPNAENLSALGLAKIRYRQSPQKRMSNVLIRGRLIYNAIKSDYAQIIQMLEQAGVVK
jgi:ankyrin repeat protein